MPELRQEPIDPALRAIKAAHTLVWAIFAGCIVALPIFAWKRQFGVAFVLMAVVGIEIVVLLFNGMKCPMTGVAARYTEDRRDNFDIYLPLWIARYNKQIFGTLFVAGALYTLARWNGR
jgi:membrane-bound metal-dependent hydrolase YbcI (DUF457 family)